MTIPLVSIVIPTHNRPELLRRALRSVVAQTFSDFEVIVVDDGEAPRVKDVVLDFHDDRFRYIAHEPANKGGSVARNTGIKMARSLYVAFLDDDDEWETGKLKIQMDELVKTSEEVGFSVTAVRNLTDTGEVLNTVMPGVHDFLPVLLLRFKGFLTSALVVKALVFKDVGLFDASLPSHQESDLLLRIAQKYKGIGIDEPLVRMNMLSDRGERISGDLGRRIRGREMLLEKHQALYSKHPKELGKHYFWLGLWCRDAGHMDKARTYFLKASRLTLNPRYFAHAFLALCKNSCMCQK